MLSGWLHLADYALYLGRSQVQSQKSPDRAEQNSSLKPGDIPSIPVNNIDLDRPMIWFSTELNSWSPRVVHPNSQFNRKINKYASQQHIEYLGLWWCCWCPEDKDHSWNPSLWVAVTHLQVAMMHGCFSSNSSWKSRAHRYSFLHKAHSSRVVESFEVHHPRRQRIFS